MLTVSQSIPRPPKLFQYFGDESCLYTLSVPDSYVELSVFNSKDLRLIETFQLIYRPQYLVPSILDKNCIFLPSVDGRLIGQDKFSGKLLVDVDLGPMMIVSEPCQDNEFIYSLCGIPIADRALRPNTKTFCVCINNKISGKKIGQTQSLVGQPSGLCLHEKLWLVVDRVLYQFSKQGELEKTRKLSFWTPYKPIFHANHIFVCSQSGLVEVFDADLNPINRFMTGTNMIPPISAQNLYWFIKDAVYEISNTSVVSHIPINETVNTDAVPCGSYIIAGSAGSLVCFDQISHRMDSLKLGEKLDKPVVINRNIFVASENEVFQLCIA